MSRESPQDGFRKVLVGEHPALTRNRVRFKHLPSDPRCKLCWAPFGGIGGAVVRHFGFGRFPGNPAICQNCISQFRKMGMTGAEIPVTLLFVDIRGSTGLGERLTPTEFRDYLGRFYRLGSKAILEHDGLIDKVVGDEIIGLFFGGVSGPEHAQAGLAAAIQLMSGAGRRDASPQGPILVGGALHTGEAFVGPTGPENVVDDFTALGDAVNTTARLASAAAAGELLVSVAAADAAGGLPPDSERRTLEVRGREATIDVIVLRPADERTSVSA
jgi:adenylate cyclase